MADRYGMKTGTVTSLELTQGRPGGRIKCECCAEGYLEFEATALFEGLTHGPELIGRRVRYSQICYQGRAIATGIRPVREADCA